MRNAIKISILTLVLGVFSSPLLAEYSVDVNFPGIKNDRIVLSGGREYLVTPDTKCFAEDGNPISYKSIYNVGHIDRARITIDNGKVTKIKILDIQM